MCSQFDTSTEEAFHNFMLGFNIDCEKIQTSQAPTPDFICRSKDNQNITEAVFEIKEFQISGTMKILGAIVTQRVTTHSTLRRFLIEAEQKFSNPNFVNLPSGLVVTNLRPLRYWERFLNEVSRFLENSFNKWSEVGTVIVAGHNPPSNQIVALHIFDNPISQRKIPRYFFKNTRHQYWRPGDTV